MPRFSRWLLAIGIVLLGCAALPARTGAHAALERSEPAAGTSLDAPPPDIRIWFTEPLEQTYTGAELLDASGMRVPDVAAVVAPGNSHELIISVPSNLSTGTYTVAWRTLSSADGHTLDGYFGFSIGEVASSTAAAPMLADIAGWRPLSRGLALIGLAALLAFAPLTLGIFDPLARSVPLAAEPMTSFLRRYAMFAAFLALLGSAVALVAQAMAVVPGASVVDAVRQTLGDTRYGQLWLWRAVLLCATIILIAMSFRRGTAARRPMLLAAATTSILCPIPFSLLSHAAAQTEGRDSALASDVLHLLTASLWAGGLFMLVLVLLPVLVRLDPSRRHAALRVAIPRFSVLGIAAWAILLLSGLYASWLQVGTIQALRETDYGQTLLLKGLLLLPVLALAAWHFVIGWRGVDAIDARHIARTLAVEGLLIFVVLLVVGRLIGLEPAREVVAGGSPGKIELALTFAASGEERSGTLTISPGVAGNNTFALTIDGAALPEGSEGVLRFALPGQSIGEQELRLPEVAANHYRAEGSELALNGDWQIQAFARKIGSVTWQSTALVPIGAEPPPAEEPNQPLRFTSLGVAGMVALAIGLAAISGAALALGAGKARRGALAIGGAAGVIAGALLLSSARLPAMPGLPALETASVASVLSPPGTAAASTPEAEMHRHEMQHATPEPLVATIGTPVSADGFRVTLALDPRAVGPVNVTVDLLASDGKPLADARVALVSHMEGMESDRAETVARETSPGRYVASGVPLSMAGEWRLAVRISPKGASTQIIPFDVQVP